MAGIRCSDPGIRMNKDVRHLAHIKALEDANASLLEHIEWLQANQHGALIETVEQLKAENVRLTNIRDARDRAQRHADEHACAAVRMQHEREELRAEDAFVIRQLEAENARAWEMIDNLSAEVERLQGESAYWRKESEALQREIEIEPR